MGSWNNLHHVKLWDENTRAQLRLAHEKSKEDRLLSFEEADLRQRASPGCLPSIYLRQIFLATQEHKVFDLATTTSYFQSEQDYDLWIKYTTES